MKDTNYAFCVARIRALENKLLTSKDIADLIDKNSYSDALRFLSEKGYDCENDDLASIIKNESNKLQTLLSETVPDKKEMESLYIVNDYFNLKVLVKCAVASENPEKYIIYPTKIDVSEFKKDNVVFSSDDDYAKIAHYAYDIALKTGNGKFCDSIIDRAAIDKLCDIAKKKKVGLLEEICGFIADTANIKITFRCIETAQDSSFISESIGQCFRLNRDKLVEKTIQGSEELVSYLETTEYKKGIAVYTSEPSEFDKWCDNELIIKAGSSVYKSFGFDPVVSYFYRKNLEIKTVRIVLNGLKSDTDKNIIRERVRQFYA